MAKWKGNNNQGFNSSLEIEKDRRVEDLPKTNIPEYNPTEALPSKKAISSPSQPSNIIQDENISNKNANINRGNILKRDDDTVKNNSINLIDIDSTIINYLNSINLQVTENGGNILKVPVIYGSPENWKATQVDGYIRDKKGQIQCPIIMIKRNSITKNQALSTLSDHTEKFSKVFVQPYSVKNQYDKFSILNKNSVTPSIPVKEVYNIEIAHQIVIEYECMIWTDYIEQLNKLVEQLNYISYKYWGDPQRYKFYSKVDSFSNQTEVGTDEDRVVRSSFNISVNGYLLPETTEDRKSTTQKSLTPRKVVFSTEVINKITDI
jgi:hypothetical protein